MNGGRLDVIKSLILPAERIADVGCDHAIIAEYCINSGYFKNVIASDISEKCLQKAKVRLGSAKNATFYCCDGLGYECDEAVIAGMGGLLISEILVKAKTLPQTLIVCPHRDEYTVRKTLVSLNYRIDCDIPIEDRKKHYSVIRAVKCEVAKALDELQLHFGVNYKTPNAALKSRLVKLRKAYMNAPRQNADKLDLIDRALKFQDVGD
ncbi:MAG: SAM-dependent methyltransferase [Clostridiales bacterium]|nr:SAM-dependent methyltransferase [Clostridiales bacterium]